MRALIEQVRLFVLLARPAVVIAGVLFAVLGAAHAGATGWSLLPAVVATLGFLVASVAVNDLSDVAVDQVNLPGVAARPLVTRRADGRQMIATAVAGVVVSLACAAWIGWAALALTVGLLVLSLAYSLPPLRLSGRGAVAPLVLPLGFVALPFLDGVLAASGRVSTSDLVLLGGLALGFVGRIVLKDFRDVRGDALLGKRTFLVRHGRVATVRFSAAFWVLGSTAVLAVRELTPTLLLGWTAQVGLALWLLRELARCTQRRREDALIRGIALVGRSQVVLVILHYLVPGTPVLLVGFVAFTTTTLASRVLAAPAHAPAAVPEVAVSR